MRLFLAILTGALGVGAIVVGHLEKFGLLTGLLYIATAAAAACLTRYQPVGHQRLPTDHGRILEMYFDTHDVDRSLYEGGQLAKKIAGWLVLGWLTFSVALLAILRFQLSQWGLQYVVFIAAGFVIAIALRLYTAIIYFTISRRVRQWYGGRKGTSDEAQH